VEGKRWVRIVQADALAALAYAVASHTSEEPLEWSVDGDYEEVVLGETVVHHVNMRLLLKNCDTRLYLGVLDCKDYTLEDSGSCTDMAQQHWDER
jgi:hypothetical protein